MANVHKIIKESIVKGSGLGYWVCETDPVHPAAITLKDRNKRYIYLHRAILENKLGRYLKPNEQAHHKNERKSDNSPANIELINKGEHQKQHALERNLGKYDRTKMKNPNGNAKKKAMGSMVQGVILKYASKKPL